MALLGLSLILASVVYVIFRPPTWLSPRYLPTFLRDFNRGAIANGGTTKSSGQEKTSGRSDVKPLQNGAPRIQDEKDGEISTKIQNGIPTTASSSVDKSQRDSFTMPPPPPPTIQPPSIEEPEEATTPRATPAQPPQTIPSFSLSESPSSPAGSMMPPPPPPSRPSPSRRVPSLPQFPAANSAQRARGPLPNRGPSSSLSPSGLAPPPTHSSKPSKPNRKVLLEPGHSPLDWARISGPAADLRGVPSSTPYMRVTPSMLKHQTGRKGKDAWMALNGKVYNVSPYAKFHPGGVPELMKGAARDGTKLFGEIHPWVNYETMLSACLIGLLVEEPQQPDQVSEMDEMD